MTEQAFLQAWRADISAGIAGVQLVDVDHPLEVYVGTSDLGAPRLQVRSAFKPQVPELSDIVVVDRVQSGDSWILTLTLGDHRFLEVFLRLAAHLVSRSSAAGTEAHAWTAVDAVFDEWHRLLKRRPMGRLSLDGLRGLVGEAWFLLHRLSPTMPTDAALLGWLGPLGAPQDFWYSDLGALEVKAVGPSSRAVRISSAAQLDVDPMQLVVLVAPQAAPSEIGAVNLVGLVGALNAGLDALSLPHTDVEMRLSRLGVDLDDDYYKETHFRIDRVETYAVDGTFPAVRSSTLAPGVVGVTYAIERTALTPHLVSTEALG